MINYYMPTKIIWGDNVVKDNQEIFKEMGKKALIVTGKSSSKKNGSLNDVIETLKLTSIEYDIFDQVEENPSIDNIMDGASKGKNIDFIIGIGGGSPIDAAKAIAVVIKNKNLKPRELMFEKPGLDSIPLISIPSTAGTGTEVTPYSIITDHEKKTKSNFCQRVYPKYALIDVKYFITMPKSIRINTSVDALTHLIEGYLNINSNILNEYIAEEGIKLWGECVDDLNNDVISNETMNKLILASTLGGILISQTGTSLPHGMGYFLTYNKAIPHGKANGVVLEEYMKICKNVKKINKILNLLGFDNLSELGNYMTEILGTINLTEEEISEYSKSMFNNKNKLKNHPEEVSLEDIYNMYSNSVLKVK